MKTNIFLVLIIELLLYNPKFGLCQENIEDFAVIEKPDRFFYDKGSKAFLFQIDEDFKLNNFQGTTFSFKYHFSPKMAMRFGVGGFFNKVDSTITTQNLTDQETDALQTRVKGLIQLLICQNMVDNVSAYLGFGPVVIYNYQRFSSDIGKIKSYSIGGSINYGIEWIIKRKVALLFEGGIIGSYNYRNETKSSQNTQDKITSYTVKNDKVKFGVALYF